MRLFKSKKKQKAYKQRENARDKALAIIKEFDAILKAVKHGYITDKDTILFKVLLNKHFEHKKETWWLHKDDCRFGLHVHATKIQFSIVDIQSEPPTFWDGPSMWHRVTDHYVFFCPIINKNTFTSQLLNKEIV